MDATYINTMDDMVDQLKSNTMSFGECFETVIVRDFRECKRPPQTEKKLKTLHRRMH